MSLTASDLRRPASAQTGSEDNGPWPRLSPVGGRRGEKKVLQFLLARPQRGMVGFDRGELTPHPGRLLRGHPSSTVQIDCVLVQNLPSSSDRANQKPSGRSRPFTSTPCRARAHENSLVGLVAGHCSCALRKTGNEARKP
jgi:hypothetical protein